MKERKNSLFYIDNITNMLTNEYTDFEVNIINVIAEKINIKFHSMCSMYIDVRYLDVSEVRRSWIHFGEWV